MADGGRNAEEGRTTRDFSDEESRQETDDEKLERQYFWKVIEAFLYYNLLFVWCCFPTQCEARHVTLCSLNCTNLTFIKDPHTNSPWKYQILKAREYSLRKLQRTKENYTFLPRRHKEMLPNFKDHLKKIEQCIEENQKFLFKIISETNEMFENRDSTTRIRGAPNDPASQPISGFDMDKVITTMKQFVRDWSDEGKSERDACYKPIIDEILRLFPMPECSSRKDISILVPGAGLARLMFDIAKLGYTCQGNEWSLYMLFASHFILNRAPGKYHTTIYPYIHQTCNNRSASDQVRPVVIPDVDPTDVPDDLNFSMAAGDFLEVYTEQNCWDCIVTCYFIDTAHNVVAYIENISRLLKPGGYWINLGPLLYHFADVAKEWSVELPYEDIKRITTECFKMEIIKEQTSVPSGYIENERSMLKLLYDNVFFVARKPL